VFVIFDILCLPTQKGTRDIKKDRQRVYNVTLRGVHVMLRCNRNKTVLSVCYCICTVHVVRSLNCQYQHMHDFNVTG